MAANPHKHHPAEPPSSLARVKAPGPGQPTERHVPVEGPGCDQTPGEGSPETTVAIDDGPLSLDIEASRWFG